MTYYGGKMKIFPQKYVKFFYCKLKDKEISINNPTHVNTIGGKVKVVTL